MVCRFKRNTRNNRDSSERIGDMEETVEKRGDEREDISIIRFRLPAQTRGAA